MSIILKLVRNILCLSLSTICFVLTCPILSHCQETPMTHVALNLPLSGPLDYYGKSVEEGVETALEEDVNNRNLVKFNFEDNEGKGRQAVTVANKQLANSPDIYVSGVKPQLMAIKEIVEKHDIPHFQWIFDVNVRPQGEKNNFRTWVNFKDEPQIFLEHAKEVKPKKVAIIYVSLPHTDEEYNKLIIPGLRKQGIEDIYIQPYQMDLTDFSAMVLNIRSYKPDLLIISGFATNLGPMIKRLHEQNLIKGKNVIATYDLIDALNLVRPEWIEGIKVSAPLFLTRKDADPKIKAWFVKFKERYNKEPNYTHAYAYDMAKIIIEATKIKRTNPERTLTDIIQELDMKGLTGHLKFDEFGSLPISIERGVIRGGSLVRDGD